MHTKLMVKASAGCSTTSSRQRAFTLIELMVVMAIMAILAGLVFGAMRGMKANSMRKKSSVQIAALELGLEMYRTDFGGFPISEVDPEGDARTGATILYQALSGDGNDLLEASSPQASIGELASSQRSYMEQLDAKRNPFGLVMRRSGASYYVADPWREPYRYRCLATAQDRQSGQRNPASYDLYSHGQTENEEMQEGGGGDEEKKWITNWD
jgi:prepilin-type N-terminal cleavage/methylation domain-containing protein